MRSRVIKILALAAGLAALAGYSLAAPPGAAGYVSELTTIYEHFRSMRVYLNPEKLKVAARIVFPNDPGIATRLANELVSHKSRFLEARRQALLKVRDSPDAPHVAVSGLSTGGLVTAAMISKAGYQVDAFEM